MEKPKTTIVDAVRMVRAIRDAQYQELRGASHAERIAFFNSKVQASQKAADEDQANPRLTSDT